MSLQLIAPWTGKSATYAVLGPPGREYIVLLRQSGGKHYSDVTLHQEHWSSSSDHEQLFLLGCSFPRSHFGGSATTAPEWSSPAFPLLLPPPLCIYFFSLAFLWISSPVRFIMQPSDCNISMGKGVTQDVGSERVVHLLFFLWNTLKTASEIQKTVLFVLADAPGLAETTEKDLDVFKSRSVPVATKARQSHNTMLKYTRWPWWKKLGDEFMEGDAIPDAELNAELGTLFIGGRKSF